METKLYCDCNLKPLVLNIPTHNIMIPFNQSTYYNLPEAIDRQGYNLSVDISQIP